MKTLPTIILAATLHFVPTLQAQLVADGATRTLINETNSITGGVTVGTNGSFTLLVLSNNSLLTNSGVSTIGLNTTAKSNEVRLVSATARWLVGSNLSVGNDGSFNRLVISNGGWLQNIFGRLGVNPSGSNNEAVVTGSGSTWTNLNEFYVGYFGGGNRLLVNNSGSVRSVQDSYIGLSGNNNEALVSDQDSSWASLGEFYVGFFGSGNRLVVSNAASVRNLLGGYLGAGSTGHSNLAVITGSGSVWSNASDLYVGYNSPRNQLVVSNGASVFSMNHGFVGFNPAANSNTVIVTGAGSRWMGGPQSTFYVGSNSAFNQLIITNGGLVADNDGSVGHQALGMSNLVIVTGSGSTWSNRTSILELGNGGSGNRLVISNGGTVYAPFVRLGRSTSGINNDMLVTGTGSSLLSPEFGFRLGESGSGNRVEISNGASVVSAGGEIGASSSTNNQVLVTGPGTLWANTVAVVVGTSGNRNRLVISNAAAVQVGTRLVIGEQSIGTNNLVVVHDGRLTVTNGSGTGFLEARRGTNVLNAGLIDLDRLVMTNTLGRFEFNSGTLITRSAAISNGANFVVGTSGSAPALWDVRAGVSPHVHAGQLFVGNNSPFNQLLVTNGALLTSVRDVFIGFGSGGHSNTALISGTGSRWVVDPDLVEAYLQVGYSGSFNRLVVSNGGWVTCSIGEIGRFAAGNNLAVVTGAGSVWTNSAELRVGVDGTGNGLVVTNGGMVVSSNSFLGFSATSSNNFIAVTGAGSVLSNRAGLFIGQLFAGPGNQLLVSNGAAVLVGRDAVIGGNIMATSNSVIVADPGTRLAITTNLIVGSNSPFNRLTIQNGATLRFSGRAFIGQNSTSGSNVVLLTGAGSTWTNQQQLIVGSGGSGNRLVISNGAVLEHISGFGSLGTSSFNSNNEAIVTGPGSLWNLPVSDLTVGELSHGNRLMISNGSMVRVRSGYIGASNIATNNGVVVTGGGSVWTNLNLFVGLMGRGNSLLVSNGGSVFSTSAAVGSQFFASDNVAVVAGAGSTWTIANDLKVGGTGERNRLVITNGGTILSSDRITMGEQSASTNNRAVVDGGTLRVTNAAGTGVLDIRRGTNVLNAGLIEVDQLVLTNSQGRFEFNGGTLSVKNASVQNGQVFRVGNGVTPATLALAGNDSGFYAFDPPGGLVISSNGTLIGNGLISGGLAVQAGGSLSPGTSIGKIAISSIASPVLQGTVLMEISKSGPVLTNDVFEITVVGPFTYGGALVVSNRGPGALAVGDVFPLFSANNYSGGFTNTILPPLPAGLGWTNKLLVNGSIEVIAVPMAQFTSITASGTNVVISGTNGIAGANYAVLTATNVTTPLSNWVSLVTNQFGAGGSFSFTNAIAPGIPQRFFRLRTP